MKKQRPTREKVVNVAQITTAEWHGYRRTGWGGSDAPTIAGVNPFSSRYYLYLEKTGQIPPKEDNEAMRQGRDLEEYVAQRWCEATGKRVKRNNFMWRSTEHPFMLADIDREVIGENAGLECKTTSVWNKADMENGEVPLNYYVQCQHYCYTMGFDRMYLAIVVLGKGFHHFVIERDDDEIEALIKLEQEMWECVQNGTPPDPDGSDATDTAIRAKYPAADAVDEPAMLTEKSETMLKTIESLDEQIKELTAARKAAQAAVELEMGECTFGDIGGYAVTWKPQVRTTIDSRRLKKEKPEIWEEFAKTSESRVFKVKKKEVEDNESVDNV